MAKVVNLPPGVLLSIRQFSDECGHDRDTVTKRIKAAGLAPAASRGRYPVYRLRDLFRAALVTTDAGEVDPDKLKPFERHAFYKAEREKLQLEVERAELLTSLDVEQRFAATFKSIAEFFDTMPDVIERDCGANAMMISKIEERLDQLREQLYTKITEEPDDAVGAA